MYKANPTWFMLYLETWDGPWEISWLTSLLVQGTCFSFFTLKAAGRMLQRTQAVISCSLCKSQKEHFLRWSPKGLQVSELLRFCTWNDFWEIHKENFIMNLSYTISLPASSHTHTLGSLSLFVNGSRRHNAFLLMGFSLYIPKGLL